MAINPQEIKIAIVTDFFFNIRGTEKLIKAVLESLPNVDVYALVGEKKEFEKIKNNPNQNIKFTFLNKLPFIKLYYKFTYFLWPLVIELIDLSKYKLVISFSSSVAKGVIVNQNAVHISYISSPMRYAWDLKDQYFSKTFFFKLLSPIINVFLHFIRIWDSSRNNLIDYIIVNSRYVESRIKRFWNITPNQIIYPYFEECKIINNSKKEDYFLFHSSLEPNKGVIETINTAIKYKLNLVVSGSGTLLNKAKWVAKNYPNIVVKGWVSDEEKFELMSKAKAFIFPSKEDFGIVVLEALSVGTPALVIENSGASEIVNDINGVKIKTNSIEDIYKGIQKINSTKYSKDKIIESVQEFIKERFKKEIMDVCIKLLNG